MGWVGWDGSGKDGGVTAFRVAAAAAGVLSGGVTLAAGHLVAGVLRPDASPIIVVGGLLVDSTPRPVRDFAIRTFGSSDKMVLLIGIGVVLALAAAAIGVVARRQLGRGMLAVGFFGLVGAIAVLTRPAPTPIDLVPTVLGTAAGCLALRYLIGLLPAYHENSAGALSRSPAVASTASTAPASTAPASTAPASTETPSTAAPSTRPTPSTASPSTADPSTAGLSTGASPSTASLSTGPSLSTASPSEAGPSTMPGLLPGGWDRRRFMWAGGTVAGGAALAGLGGRWLAGLRFSAEASRAAVRLPRPVSAAPPVPASADPRAGGVAYLTSNDDFYRVDTALVLPQVASETWSLRVHGMVQREVRISYADLLGMPMVERVITLACVSNEVGGEYVGTARWLGVPVRTVLAAAGVDPSADQLVCRSADGLTIGAPTRIVTDGRDALLAVGMNGEPLPIAHGFPVRMVVPGLYGYCSACKWIVEIEASTFGRFDAYWVRQGWAQIAEIRTESRIDTPRDSSKIPAGRTAVAGIAWAQHRGISAVEVAVDGGGWQPATVATQPTKDAWRLWTFDWDAQPGKHSLMVRATDGTGAVQTSTPADPYPSGATGYHTIDVTVR
jgi:DMSO/TMAO reductase YedYZ molybdopterin-dependent catalytic subunit